jgi:hypothetical protein
LHFRDLACFFGFFGGWDRGVALFCLFPIKKPKLFVDNCMSEYFLHPWCQFFKLITDRLHCNIFWCRDRTILILVSWNSVEIFTFMQTIPSEYHLNLYINDAYIQTCSCGHLYWKVTFFLSCYWKFHVNWTSTGATSGAGLPTLPEHLNSIPGFSRVRVTRSLILCVMSCRSLFVLLFFFFWPLCCLSFFDLRIPITPLVSSNSS